VNKKRRDNDTAMTIISIIGFPYKTFQSEELSLIIRVIRNVLLSPAIRYKM